MRRLSTAEADKLRLSRLLSPIKYIPSLGRQLTWGSGRTSSPFKPPKQFRELVSFTALHFNGHSKPINNKYYICSMV
jgi:hypothetical protein